MGQNLGDSTYIYICSGVLNNLSYLRLNEINGERHKRSLGNALMAECSPMIKTEPHQKVAYDMYSTHMCLWLHKIRESLTTFFSILEHRIIPTSDITRFFFCSLGVCSLMLDSRKEPGGGSRSEPLNVPKVICLAGGMINHS